MEGGSKEKNEVTQNGKNAYPLDDEDHSDDDYDIEAAGGSDDDIDDDYYDEKEKEMAQMQIKAMIARVINLTEQCGDVNLAMNMMRLDNFEKSIVVQHL